MNAPGAMAAPPSAALMEQLVSRRLLVREDGDEFAFRHALTYEAVYGTL
jgi:hypothetical protein